MNFKRLHFGFAVIVLMVLFAFSSFGTGILNTLQFFLSKQSLETGYLSPFECQVSTNGSFCFSLPPGTCFFDANKTDYLNLGFVTPEDPFVDVYKIYIVMKPETVRSMMKLVPGNNVLTYPGPGVEVLDRFQCSKIAEDNIIP